MANNNEKLIGIIGYPLKQSLSPLLHNYWIEKNNINAHYTAFTISKLKNINKAIKVLNIKGLNVTIPYKKKIIKYLDEIEITAERMGAVNTILNIKGKLKGYNTDIYGFKQGLDYFKKWDKEKPVVIIGAGGAAESAIYALIKISCKQVYVMNRTLSKSKKLADKYKNVNIAKWLSYDIINQAGLIINTTSLGMIGYPNLQLNLKDTLKDLKVYDVVYNPLDTGLIKEAKIRGLDYMSGLTMFLGQAQKRFNLWFNKSPIIDKALLKLLHQHLRLK